MGNPIVIDSATQNISGTNTNANTISGGIANGGATSVALTKDQAGTWSLSSDGSITGTLLPDYTSLNLGVGLTGSFNNGTGVFSITSAVPELSRALLLIAGLIGVVMRRGRKL